MTRESRKMQSREGGGVQWRVHAIEEMKGTNIQAQNSCVHVSTNHIILQACIVYCYKALECIMKG